jgi:hypothetical protein
LFFTESSLKYLVKTCGFEVIAIAPCGRRIGEADSRMLIRNGMRSISKKLVAKPPRWLDRLVHPHFSYYEEGAATPWLRLLARLR